MSWNSIMEHCHLTLLDHVMLAVYIQLAYWQTNNLIIPSVFIHDDISLTEFRVDGFFTQYCYII
jgi:hypothetical protein